MRAPRSLQARLLLLVLGAVAVAWLVAAAVTLVNTRHELEESLQGHEFAEHEAAEAAHGDGPAEARNEILWAVTKGVVGPLVLALPLLGGLVWWAVRRGLSPMRQLSTSLAQRAPDTLEPVSLASPGTELQTLVDALNGLLERVSGLLEAERRFTADAAHELRTPLAGLRAQAQVAMAARDENSRRHALQGTLDGCDRATHLVEQLLMLSRLEAQGRPALHAVDLAVVAQRVLAELAPRALAKQQSLALDAPAHCVVAGDETLLGALLRNLVDNAVRYSPAGARIQVALDARHLTVDDSGPGLDAAALGHLGERFFRVLGTGESGSGLGWSIVRRIALALGLTARAQTSPLGGLQVVVEGFSAPGR